MLSFLATFTAAIGLVSAAPQAPQWHSDYGTALKETREDHRPLLVVIDTPADAKSRIAPELLNGEASEALQPYELCHVDASTEYGKKVAKVFQANKFPYVAVIDNSGSVILHSQSGNVTAKAWNALLAKHKSGERTVTKQATSRPQAQYDFPSDFSYPGSTKPYCARCQRGY